MRRKRPARRARPRTPRRPAPPEFPEEERLEIDRIERHLRAGTQKAEGDRDE